MEPARGGLAVSAGSRMDGMQVWGKGHSRPMCRDVRQGAGPGPDAGACRVPREQLRLHFVGSTASLGDLSKEVASPNPDLLRG